MISRGEVMKLLIVDDHSPMRTLIKTLVAGLADEVYECSDGSEVLAAYSRHQPDWVLMDVEMREVDGLTASRQLIAAFPAARIIIVTKHDDEEMRAEARAAGACDYVLKENLLTLRQRLQRRPER